jgi:hypothetical protein
MLRFRLRTLLILMAVAEVVFARIAYLKQWRDFHKREVAKLVESIRIAEGEDRQIADSVINDFAMAGRPIGWGNDLTQTKVGITNGPLVRWIKDSTTLEKDFATFEIWRKAIHHQALANRYDEAMYRPWRQVSPQETVFRAGRAGKGRTIQDNVVSMGVWILQAETLFWLAGMLGVGAVMFFVFAERWANDGAKMTWAPWMQTKTPASYRRMGRIYIILAAISAVAAIIRLFSTT